MKYRRLGDAGVKLSEIGLGGWLTFGNAVDLDQTARILDRALNLGINFFDTSNVYALGRCEEVWGEILPRYKRSDYVLATKVFFPMGEGPNDRGLSRKHIHEQCHASLKRLRTDYIDLYQCHRYDPETPLEETIRVMDDLVRQGKVLYWGVSEWTAPQIEECLRICRERGWEKPKSNQPRYNLVQRGIEKEVIPTCARAGMGQVTFSPLLQGVLTGKYKPGEPIPEGTRAADERQNSIIKERLRDEDLLRRVQQLEPIASDLGCTVAQLSLAWTLRNPEVTACITGATRPEQLDQNVKAIEVKLPPEVLRKLDELFPA